MKKKVVVKKATRDLVKVGDIRTCISPYKRMLGNSGN